MQIWNANHVLEQALSPGTNGVPRSLFNGIKGLILLSVVEVGFIFSGNVGTGILLSKKEDGGWSPPSAVGLTGVGWGFLIGGSLRDLMIFLYDENSLASASDGLKVGGQMELTLGPFGRTAQANIDLSNKGVGATFAVAFSKGAFLGLSLEGAVVGVRGAANQAFYGQPYSPQDIALLGRAQLPDKVTLISDVYDKLNKLSAGALADPTPDEEAKKLAAKASADAAALQANQAPDVVQVDAAAEAAKES